MVAFAAVLSFVLLLSSSTWAIVIRDSPATSNSGSSNTQTTNTPIGRAQGILDVPGVARYAVRYGSAGRWQPSSVATTWQLPNGNTDASALPLACPQPDLTSSQYSEDCLSMILYVPTCLNTNGRAPTLVWIHGGSFVIGSATGPGLDGSNLALATNSIVAVIQYRLGALGFMAPGGPTNLAVKDVVTALSFLGTVVPSFGGTGSKITIAGQSSGANMIRALLAVPSAASLFQSAILQSDPMDYGFLSTTTQQLLLNYFVSTLGCGNSCQSATLDAILSAQSTLMQNAIGIDPSTGQAEPIRPVLDGSFITSPLDSTAPFPHVSKPILLSNVLDEAGPAIFGAFPSPLPDAAFDSIVNLTLGPTRTNTIVSSSFYQPPSTNGDARYRLETLGTDYIWKCSGWTFARNWVQHGGQAYVGVYTVGATYPDNAQIPFCTQSGSVCHEDDIMIVFGTVPNPTAAQVLLTSQMQQRYKWFLSNGNPNVFNLPAWQPATTTDVHALNLGGSGAIPTGACVPSFWGSAVQYDYQVFDI